MNDRRTILALVLLAAGSFLIAGWGTASAGPQIVTVTKTADTNDGACDSDCSLREAVIAANTVPNVGAIDIPGGTYVLSIPGTDEDSAATGDLDITESVNLYGDQAGGTTIDGGGLDRVIDNFAPSLVVDDVTIRGGALGGIRNHADKALTLADVTIIDNQGNGYRALTNNGQADLRNVTVADNGNDGGIGSAGVGATLMIDSSTISQNTSDLDGGGLRGSGGTITVTNSTISGNFAARHGGAISIDGADLALQNVTIANNTADADTDGIGDGGGVYIYGSNRTFRSTILAGNADPGGEAPDCVTENGAFKSLGHNLILSVAGCTIDGLSATDIVGEDPTLFALADNGGPTLTHLPAPGSPTIDAGDDAACPDEDQRGVKRPIGAHCDIGAVEVGLEPGQSVWGDVDCDADVDPVDALLILRFVAGLPRPGGGNPCLPIGEQFEIDEEPFDILFGDVNCDGEVNAVDALLILRFAAALPPLQASEPCPDIGSVVQFLQN